MTNSACGCGHDHDEEENAEKHECCGGGCCDDSAKDSCGCGHDHAAPSITPEKLEHLKKAILEAGYKIEETPEGEIRILEK
jgi:hypothetical protein